MLAEAGGGPSDITAAASASGGLGLFVRSLIGLDRAAALEAFERFLDADAYSVNQIRFVNLIVDELTNAGVMSPGRLYESPFPDHAPTGPDYMFPSADVTVIVETLDHLWQTARAGDPSVVA